jgi:chromosome segregation and condensation protein ScpB
VRSVSDTLGTRNAGQPLEERVEIQALSVDLREAVMACLSGGESRRWTIAELVERFKNLGVCASRASVTAALAELALELELSGWAPWRLLERGTEWILAPKSELVALLSGVRRLPVKEAMILSEEHKAVLLVVIGYRQKGGVSKARVGEILGLEASSYLDDLLRQGLIYCDPSRELNFWRPTQSALLPLGLRSHTDIRRCFRNGNGAADAAINRRSAILRYAIAAVEKEANDTGRWNRCVLATGFIGPGTMRGHRSRDRRVHHDTWDESG